MVHLAETVTAICLRSIEYTERSRIATYLSRESGKLDVLLSQAKGAKAKHGGASELGGIFNLHIRPSKAGSSLCRLEQYEVHTSLHFAKALNYEAYEALMPCLELMRLFAIAFDEDATKRQRLFAQYEALLTLWTQTEEAGFLQWSKLWFWQGLLGLSGQLPPWGWDVLHQRPIAWQGEADQQLLYQPKEGGLALFPTKMVLKDGIEQWGMSYGVWKSLCVLEALQNEPFSTFLDVPQPPLATLKKVEAFYLAVLKTHEIHLKST
jgi:hypothetical protein